MVAVPVAPDPFYFALMSDGDLLEVADLAHPPAWHADALCREHPEVDFFPPRGEPTEPAKEICRRCLCRAECLTYALEHQEKGIWGATSEKQRKNVLRGRVSLSELLAALDARTRTQRVTVAVEPEEPLTTQVVNGGSPNVERVACHSCEELFAADELVYGSWCRECW